MGIKFLSKKKMGCLLVFFFAFMVGQETMADLHKSFGMAKGTEGLRRLSQSFLQKYQQTKNEEYLANARYTELYLYRKDTLGNLKRSFQIVRYSKENSELRSRAYFWAAVFLENSALDLSLNYLKKSTELNEKFNYDLGKILSYHVMGRVYFKKRNYPKALYYFEKTLKLAQKNKDDLNASSMYNNMGMVYFQQKKYPQAIALAKKSLSLITHSYDEYFLNVVRTNLGDYYFQIKKTQEAEAYYRTAFEHYCIHPMDKGALSSALPNLYKIYETDPVKREKFIKAAQTLLDADKTSPFNITLLKVMLANAFKSGDLKEAERISTLLNSYSLGYKRFLNTRHAETSNILAQYISEEFSKEQKTQQQKTSSSTST